MKRLFLVVIKTRDFGVHYHGFSEYKLAWGFYLEHRVETGVEWAEFLSSTESEGMMRSGFFVPANGNRPNMNCVGG